MTNLIAPSANISSKRNDDPEIDFARFARALWARKYWIAAVTFAAFLFGVINAVFFTTPVYTATARIVLETDQGNFAGLDGIVSSPRTDTISINTEIRVMQSPDLLRKLVQKYDLHKDPTFNPWLRDEKFSLSNSLRSLFVARQPKSLPSEEVQIAVAAGVAAGSLNVQMINYTRIVEIRSTTIDPGSSQALANALANEYILNQIEVKFEALQQATEWLAQRVVELEKDLKSSQVRYQEFVSEKNIPTAQEMQALTRQLNDIRGRITSSEDSVIDASTKVALLERAIVEFDVEKVLEVTGDPSLRRMLQLQEQGQDMSSAMSARLDSLLQQARQDLTTLESQIETLKSSSQMIADRIERQSDQFAESEQLAQEIEASRTIYEYFLNRLKETSVQRGVQQADARVLSTAGRPGAPSAPNKTRNVISNTLMGFLLASGFLIVLELLNRGYRTSESIEADTGQTVLGQIPRIDAGTRLDILEYLGKNPNSAAAEAFRNLRTSILLSDLDSPPKVIMSTSSLPAEGKTVQAFALAMNLAAMGRKVILVEGDVRRGIFTARLGYEQGPGLIGVLAKQVNLKDALIRNEEHGFDILIGGKARTNPVDLFSSHAFEELLKELREEYDIVIIDSPPLLAVPDARVIGQHVDAIIYSVRWNATTRSQVREGLALLETVNLKVSGFVLAQVNLKTMRNYGYGAYGNYGGKYYSS